MSRGLAHSRWHSSQRTPVFVYRAVARYEGWPNGRTSRDLVGRSLARDLALHAQGRTTGLLEARIAAHYRYLGDRQQAAAWLRRARTAWHAHLSPFRGLDHHRRSVQYTGIAASQRAVGRG